MIAAPLQPVSKRCSSLRPWPACARYRACALQVTLLESLDKWERLSVADALETVTHKEGDVIMKEGDPGDDFFIIEEGECAVTKGDSADVVNTLKSADYFGEIALLEPDGTLPLPPIVHLLHPRFLLHGVVSVPRCILPQLS